jgi:hypothetical protein
MVRFPRPAFCSSHKYYQTSPSFAWIIFRSLRNADRTGSPAVATLPSPPDQRAGARERSRTFALRRTDAARGRATCHNSVCRRCSRPKVDAPDHQRQYAEAMPESFSWDWILRLLTVLGALMTAAGLAYTAIRFHGEARTRRRDAAKQRPGAGGHQQESVRGWLAVCRQSASKAGRLSRPFPPLIPRSL